ncbi:hypothetical protein [Helicobacter japonicus]|uniref:hypothetical protein n=1 Tax=Helicobacter japonicus TaxID=425400 RepID=UPI002596D60E|nr:hypothetical protein [Helicobacter japonicus]
MLRWFFDERDHSENDEYYSQWIEYIKAIDLDSTLYIYTKTKAHINFGEKFDYATISCTSIFFIFP